MAERVMADRVAPPRPRDEIVLRVDDLVVEHRSAHGPLQAVSGVSFDVRRGETLGLVGESGCGKSTMARAIMQLVTPISGSIEFEGHDLLGADRASARRLRRRMHMIFQDPTASLNPRRRVRDLVAEGPAIAGQPVPAEEIERLLGLVGLSAGVVGSRRPRELSGGQCQRVAIARGLALDPALMICDEPVSALDVSVQAQILNVLEDAKRRYGLTMLFIAHDLPVVKRVSDRIAVMYLGRLCEIGSADDVHRRAAHPYTHALLEAIPVADPRRRPAPATLWGDPPSPINPPPGCRFHTRCPKATERCQLEVPALRPIAPGHLVACHHPDAGANGANGANRANGDEPAVVP